MTDDINRSLGIAGTESGADTSTRGQSLSPTKNPWNMTATERYPRLWSSGSTLRTSGTVLKVLGCISFVLSILRFLVVVTRSYRAHEEVFGGWDWGVTLIVFGAIFTAIATYVLGVLVAGAGDAAHALADIGLNAERVAEKYHPTPTEPCTDKEEQTA